jgi:hypothetical protein
MACRNAVNDLNQFKGILWLKIPVVLTQFKLLEPSVDRVEIFPFAFQFVVHPLILFRRSIAVYPALFSAY